MILHQEHCKLASTVFMSEYDFHVDARESNLTILIPTIGRSSVTNLIDEILKDALGSNLTIRIILALNGRQEFVINSEDVVVHDLGYNKIGFSAAINSVIPVIETEYVCIVADDDSWIMGKLAHDLAALNNHEVVLASYMFIDNFSSTVRPKSLYPGTIPPSKFLYEKFSFGRSRRYISISGMTLTTELLRQNPFDCTLLIREDIEWLDRIFKRGFHIQQSNTVTMMLNVDLRRATGRETFDSLNNWADTLKHDYGSKWVRNFLSGAAIKPFILADNLEMIARVTEVAKSKLNGVDRAVFLLRKALWITLRLSLQIKNKRSFF